MDIWYELAVTAFVILIASIVVYGIRTNRQMTNAEREAERDENAIW